MSSYLIYEHIFIPSIYLYIYIYLISFIIVMGREDWFLIWVGLEINIISFLIIVYRRYRVGVIESCLKYFFIQRVGSVLIIVLFYLNNYSVGGTMLIVLRYKIGGGPFFFWFPNICAGLDWVSCYVLIFLQKFLPLLLISVFDHWLIWIIINVSLLIGILGSFNQRGIKELIAYSSVHHLGWIILVIMLMGNLGWIIYLILYRVVLLSLVVFLKYNNIVDLSIMYISRDKFIFILCIISIAGVPPFLGFFLKWMALIRVFDNLLYIILLVVASVLILYIYVRIVYDVYMFKGIINYRIFKINGLIYNIESVRLGGILLGVFLCIYLLN